MQKFKVRAKVARARKVKAPVEAAAAAVVMPAPGSTSSAAKYTDDAAVTRLQKGFNRGAPVVWFLKPDGSRFSVDKTRAGIMKFVATSDGGQASRKMLAARGLLTTDETKHSMDFNLMKDHGLLTNKAGDGIYKITPRGVNTCMLLLDTDF
jgi:hypothetical protein